jgi:hypothetical protein
MAGASFFIQSLFAGVLPKVKAEKTRIFHRAEI